MTFTLLSYHAFANAQIQNWPENIDEITHLDYFLEFNPKKNYYSTTNYSLEFKNFELNAESMLNITITYENIDLTTSKENFGYNVSLESLKIHNVSLIDYETVMNSTQTELFLNLSEAKMGNPQTFRIDEITIFKEYLETEDRDEVKNIEKEFNYIGEELYDKKLNFTFNTYHYNTSESWTHGC